jgi:hypothetical protein
VESPGRHSVTLQYTHEERTIPWSNTRTFHGTMGSEYDPGYETWP